MSDDETTHAAAPRGGGVRVSALTLGVALLVACIATIAAGPAGYRIGTLGLEAATAGVANAGLVLIVCAAFASLLGLILSVAGKRTRGAIVGVLTLTASLMIGFRIYAFHVDREDLPPIHDVQTDWERPVAFSAATLDLRKAAGAALLAADARVAEDEGRWSGMTFAEAQAEVYADLGPLTVNAAPMAASAAVLSAAERLGWAVVLSELSEGRIEATTESFWYGLQADVAVRVTQEGEGARIDVRSAGRTPGPDMGGNARRIKALLDEVAFALRGE